jgi:hypothetical protein
VRVMHERGDLRRSADPDRLAMALFAAVQGGLVLPQVHRQVASLEAALGTTLEYIVPLTNEAPTCRLVVSSDPSRIPGSSLKQGLRRVAY